jgi:hypothetical protein
MYLGVYNSQNKRDCFPNCDIIFLKGISFCSGNADCLPTVLDF